MRGLVELVDAEPRRAPGLRRGLRGLAIFAGVFACAALALRALTPPYLVTPEIGRKLAHLAGDPHRYDTLFIGSSYVYRGVVPSLFDAVTRERGLPTTSFNFGVPGMRGLETEFVLEQVLSLEPRRLRWVWIEPNDLARRPDSENRESERFQAWHDLRQTWRALDLWRGGRRPGYDAAEWSREHLPAFARHLLGPGRGVDWMRALRDPVGLEPEPGYDGFDALDVSEGPDIERRHADFVRRLDVFRERTARVASGIAAGGVALEPFERRFLLRLRHRVEAAGARVIFFVPPLPYLRSQYPVRAAALGVVPVTLNYTDPQRHPELYDPALRFDQSHLNREGARRFTRLLAEDFVRHAKAPRRVAELSQNWK